MAKILLITSDLIGPQMAGPAIRYYEMARTLSKSHQVVLMTTLPAQIEPQGFRLATREALWREMKAADAVITQNIDFKMAWYKCWLGTKIVLDAYDPLPLEHLEIFKHYPLDLRKNRSQVCVELLNMSFKLADGILVANEAQKDLWIGFLMAKGLITPELYDQNGNLSHFVAIVPFGLPSIPPARTKPEIPSKEKIILWGGGIWNWFDPLTLIRAVHLLSRKDIKLVFMGLKHPNKAVPEMKMAQDAVELARELGINVHFNYGWTPYEERQNLLLDADIGVSTHFDHLETRFAFRTRILDYLWADLPMVVSKGDSFAELIEKEKLGLTVDCEDVQGLARALETLLDDQELRSQMKSNIAFVKKRFEWNEVIQPIHKMVELSSAKRGQLGTVLKSFIKRRNPLSVYKALKVRRRM